MELAVTPLLYHSGSVPCPGLAPLLFLCFVNDIPLNVISKIKLYADDILLYHTISSVADYTLLKKHTFTASSSGPTHGNSLLTSTNANLFT